MRTCFVTLFALTVLFSGCNKKTSTQTNTITKPPIDSIEIITKYFENSAKAVEYEIPIISETKVKHGIQKRYYLHGSLYSEIQYIKGKRNGISRTYYPVLAGAEPILWKEQPYLNDNLEGICKRYHKDGSLQSEYEYKNGLPGVGLKEFYQSSNPVKLPELVLNSTKTAQYFYVTAKLSNNKKNVDFFIGNLIEGKFLPDNLKGLQVKNGVGEILVPLDSKNVTITAVHFTAYKNRHIISKTKNLQSP